MLLASSAICLAFLRRSERFKAVLDPLNDMKKFLGETRKAEGRGGIQQPRLSSRKTGVLDRPVSEISEKLDRKERKKKKKHKKETKAKKNKKHKRAEIEKEEVDESSESDDEEKTAKARQLELLRHQRLMREKEERARAEKLLNPHRQKEMKQPVEDDR